MFPVDPNPPPRVPYSLVCGENKAAFCMSAFCMSAFCMSAFCMSAFCLLSPVLTKKLILHDYLGSATADS